MQGGGPCDVSVSVASGLAIDWRALCRSVEYYLGCPALLSDMRPEKSFVWAICCQLWSARGNVDAAVGGAYTDLRDICGYM